MTDRSRRKELVSEYKQTRREAGVYRVVNTQTGKSLLGSSLNLESVRSKMEFARKTGSSGVLGYQLKSDIERLGIDAFELEILEVLEIQPEMSDAQVRSDLTALEQLWRERYAAEVVY